jgi:hypothetical protein
VGEVAGNLTDYANYKGMPQRYHHYELGT